MPSVLVLSLLFYRQGEGKNCMPSITYLPRQTFVRIYFLSHVIVITQLFRQENIHMGFLLFYN